jgi:hypothetical protein
MSATVTRPRFDFDAWVELARQDPQAFEKKRKHIIEAAIQGAPEQQQQRLRCLQWKLDKIRETSRTPMMACLQINRLLWENVTGEHGLLNSLQHLQRVETEPQNRRKKAKVIPLNG